MDARALLLTVAIRHRIREPNIETGYETFAGLTGEALSPRRCPTRPGQPVPHDVTSENAPNANATVTFDAFRDAVAACLREGLIREPIRLPEGALQCHWHLELTPAGVAAARQIGRPEISPPHGSEHG